MWRWRKEVAGSSSGKLEVACRGRVLVLVVLLEQGTIVLLLVQQLHPAQSVLPVLLYWSFLPVLASAVLQLKHLLPRQAPLVSPLLPPASS